MPSWAGSLCRCNARENPPPVRGRGSTSDNLTELHQAVGPADSLVFGHAHLEASEHTAMVVIFHLDCKDCSALIYLWREAGSSEQRGCSLSGRCALRSWCHGIIRERWRVRSQSETGARRNWRSWVFRAAQFFLGALVQRNWRSRIFHVALLPGREATAALG
eukprot:2934532-Prymnesium_polylepis.2